MGNVCLNADDSLGGNLRLIEIWTLMESPGRGGAGTYVCSGASGAALKVALNQLRVTPPDTDMEMIM